MGLFFGDGLMKNKRKVAKMTNQSSLQFIFEESDDKEIRLIAIGRITDADYLYKKIGEDKEINLALINRLRELNSRYFRSAVLKCKQQKGVGDVIIRGLTEAELFELMRPSSGSCLNDAQLVERIVDQNLLGKLYLEKASQKKSQQSWKEEDEAVAEAVLRKIRDKEVSLQILSSVDEDEQGPGDVTVLLENLTDEDLRSRMNTFRYIKDQKILEDIVLNSPNREDLVREAIPYVRDQKVVEQLIREKPVKKDLKEEAIRYISDPQILNGLASDKTLDSGFIRKPALKKIYDPVILNPILKDPEEKSGIIEQAVRQIQDRDMLLKMLKSNEYSQDVKASILLLKDVPEDFRTEIALSSESDRVRCNAIYKIENRNYLKRIMVESDNVKIRQCACGEMGHEFAYAGTGREYARSGRGHREWSIYKCKNCGLEEGRDACEYDD